MNLMNMLADNSGAFRGEPDMSSYLDQPPLQQVNGSGNSRNTVHYLPTIMSPLQRDMSEAVVQILSPALHSIINSRRQKTSINNLLVANDDVLGGETYNSYADAKSCSLMYNSLSTICMHPSLVVDHFISKGMLLSSTKERLSNMSGKLILFEKIIDTIAEKYELQAPTDDYNVMVIAKSVKELELIEGLVIGKKLRYENISNGKRLYEDGISPDKFKREGSVEEDMAADNYKRRRFAERMNKKATPPARSLVVHFITSNHLDSSYSSNIAFDLMISFDAELDTSSPSVEFLRSHDRESFQLTRSSKALVPVLIPIPVFSVEHLVKRMPRPEADIGNLSAAAESDWTLQLVETFVANRSKLFTQTSEEFFIDNYGKNMSNVGDWLMNWTKTPPPSELDDLKKFDAELTLQVSDKSLSASLEVNYLNRLLGSLDEADNKAFAMNLADGPISDYTTFTARLAQFLHARITQTESVIGKIQVDELPGMRVSEAERQDKIDECEGAVAEHYRKLRRLNEDVSIVDRKFKRAESENQKLSESYKELEAMVSHLEDVLNNKSEEDLKKIAEEQKVLIDSLTSEKERLRDDIDVITKDSESGREEYQLKSGLAVQASEKLRVLKEKQKSLEEKTLRPGMQILPSLAQKDEIAIYESQLRKLVHENQFIASLYAGSLDKLVKERTVLLDNTTSGSTSRTTNRISRAATPF